MIYDHGTFQCVVVAPSGKQVDCYTTSVILPAHDGMVGIWHNHMPMFCELGMGIMEIESAASPDGIHHERILMFIDGGFALLASNYLSIIAYDAVCPKIMKIERIEHLIERTRKKAADPKYSFEEQIRQRQKADMLAKLIELHKTAFDLQPQKI